MVASARFTIRVFVTLRLLRIESNETVARKDVSFTQEPCTETLAQEIWLGVGCMHDAQ